MLWHSRSACGSDCSRDLCGLPHWDSRPFFPLVAAAALPTEGKQGAQDNSQQDKMLLRLKLYYSLELMVLAIWDER